jgi:hypothetical protein
MKPAVGTKGVFRCGGRNVRATVTQSLYDDDIIVHNHIDGTNHIIDWHIFTPMDW